VISPLMKIEIPTNPSCPITAVVVEPASRTNNYETMQSSGE
jgi:hypothetical protein